MGEHFPGRHLSTDEYEPGNFLDHFLAVKSFC